MRRKTENRCDSPGDSLPPFVELLFPARSRSHEPLIDDLLLRYPDYNDGMECLEDLDDLDSAVLAEHCVLLTAGSRHGKTRLITEYISRRMPTRSPSGLVVPVLYVNIPEHPTIKNLSVAILRQFHIVPSTKDSAEDMFISIIELLHQCRVRVVCLDDLHQFVDREGVVTQFNLTNWLRRLCMFGKVALVVSGLDRVKQALRLNEQLYNRFDAEISLRRFDWLVTEDMDVFTGLLREVHRNVAKEFAVPVFDRKIAFRWYVASGGRIGIVIKIWRRALKLARKSGKRQISLDTLDASWRRTLVDAPDCPDGDRPFGPSFEQSMTVDRASSLAAAAKLKGLEEPAPRQRPGGRASARAVRDKLAAAMGR